MDVALAVAIDPRTLAPVRAAFSLFLAEVYFKYDGGGGTNTGGTGGCARTAAGAAGADYTSSGLNTMHLSGNQVGVGIGIGKRG